MKFRRRVFVMPYVYIKLGVHMPRSPTAPMMATPCANCRRPSHPYEIRLTKSGPCPPDFVSRLTCADAPQRLFAMP